MNTHLPARSSPRVLVALTALVAGTCAASCGTATTTPDPHKPPASVVTNDEGAVAVVGRFDRPSDTAARFAWSMTAIDARFTGTAVAADLEEADDGDGTNRFLVVIDGVELGAVQPPAGRSVVPLATGLRDGEHTLRLVRLTEAQFGPSTYHGLVLDEGAELLAPPTPRPRRIEVIGDSLSAGYGDLGTDPNCPFTPETEDAAQAWAGIAAAQLDAEVSVVAWSGKGVLRNYDPGDPTTMRALWSRAVPQDDTSAWSFAGDAPDVVVVFLGTNDFAQGVPDEDAFVDAFVELLDDVRTRRPDARIVVVVPPLSDDWPEGQMQGTTASRYVDRIVAERPDVTQMAFPQGLAEDGLGCSWHPTIITHARWAEVAVGVLRPLLGW